MGGLNGTYSIGPENGRLLVRTTRTGFGAKAGHDLTIEATRWRGSATVNTANPAASAVMVEVEVASLEVREGTGGVKPLTDSDRREIQRTIQEKILHTARYPTISFASTRVDGSAAAFTVVGDLTIAGATEPITLQGRFADGRVTGSTVVTQTRWGIKPYTAFFGALKLNDDVGVEFDVTFGV